jgi:hypothetical protein
MSSVHPIHRAARVIGAIVLCMGIGSCTRHEAPKQAADWAAGGGLKKASAPVDEPTKDLPPDFSKTMPIYPGAKTESVRRPKGAMREIFFSTDAQMDQLIAFYKSALIKGGYEVTASLKMAARKTWSCDFHKRDQQASVMLFPMDEDKSRMTIDLIYEMPSAEVQLVDPTREDFDVVGPGEIAQHNAEQAKKKD